MTLIDGGKYLMKMGLAFVAGFVGVILLIMAIGLLVSGTAHGQTQSTAQPVREARLGEQNRSLLYQREAVQRSVEVPAPEASSYVARMRARCNIYNARIVERVKILARELAEDPQGHPYHAELIQWHWGFWCWGYDGAGEPITPPGGAR